MTLTLSLEKLTSHPSVRMVCKTCGEEIPNQRDISHEEMVFYRSCAGEVYYHY